MLFVVAVYCGLFVVVVVVIVVVVVMAFVADGVHIVLSLLLLSSPLMRFCCCSLSCRRRCFVFIAVKQLLSSILGQSYPLANVSR